MELSNALKSLLATLTTKTTLASTDGMMTITTSDGTPNGKINIQNLASSINAIGKFRGAGDITNVADIASAGLYLAAPSVNNSPRSDGYFAVLAYEYQQTPTKIMLLFALETNGSSAYQGIIRGTTVTWHKTAFDVPTFYNSYADLAALATGIMGRNISSITAQYFQGTIAQAVFDNVFIAVTRFSDTYPLAVKPKDWSSYNSASAYHVDGVLIVSGDKCLVIAPSEANLRWGADADSHAASGNTATSDRDAAMATFDGNARTNTAVHVSEYSSAEVAPGYCHAFTTVTSAYDTKKVAYARRKAGMWWLPSLGEIMMIWSNMTRINQVMSLIGGTPLGETYYWTSTEISQTTAWGLSLSTGIVSGGNKRGAYRVRPVAAF